MIEQYRVGITVYLNDLVGKGLKKLGAEMLGSQGRVAALQRDLNKLHRTTEVSTNRATAAQQRSVVAHNAALRAQEAVAGKTTKLNSLRAQQAAASDKFAIRQKRSQSILDTIASQSATRQATSVSRLKEKSAELMGLKVAETELLKKQQAEQAAAAQGLAHIWDRAAIAQHQMFKTRVLTGERLKKLDKEIADHQEVIDIAKRRKQKVVPLREEMKVLQQRRDALAAGLQASEIRTRVTGEQLAAQGAGLQAAMLSGNPKYKEALAKNAAAQQTINSSMEAEREAAAQRLLQLDQRRSRVAEAMAVSQGLHAAERKALEDRATLLTQQRARAVADYEKQALQSQFAKFEAAKQAGVKSQLSVAEAAVISAQKEELAAGRALAARQKTAAIAGGAGLAAVAGGMGLLHLAKGMIPEASEYQRSLMAAHGTNPAMMDQFRMAAINATQKTPWLGMNDAMQSMLDLHKAFGDPKTAIDFLPKLAELQAAMVMTIPNQDFEQAREQSFSIAKALELFGKASKDKSGAYPDFDKWITMMGKTILFSGGRLSGNDFQQLAKFVGPSVTSLSAEFMFEKLPSLMMAMKSGGGGLSNNAVFGPGARLASLLNYIQGTDSMSNAKLDANMALGLIQPGAGNGGKKSGPRMPLIGAELANKDPFEWYDKIFIPQFEKKVGKIDWEHFDTAKYKFMGKQMDFAQIVQQLTRGNRYAGWATAMIVKNLHGMIAKDQAAIQQQQDAKTIVDYHGSKSYMLQSQVGDAQRTKFQELLGTGVLERWTQYLGFSNSALIALNDTMARHPELTRLAGKAMVDLGATLTVIGTIGTVYAIGKWTGGLKLMGEGLKFVGGVTELAAWGSLIPIAVGLGEVAIVLGTLYTAAMYFTDEKFRKRVNTDFSDFWSVETVKRWLGMDGVGRTNMSEAEKVRYNMLAAEAGMPPRFPEVGSGPMKNLTDPGFTAAPKGKKTIQVKNYVMLDKRVAGESMSEFHMDQWGVPTSDFSRPDYRDIPTASTGRTER